MNRKSFLTAILALVLAVPVSAQRFQDKLDRGLVAVQTSGGVFCSWRILGEEYYNVQYNLYRDGTKVNSTPLNVSNYTDASGSASSTYTVKAVVNGVEQDASSAASVITTTGTDFGYLEIPKPKRISVGDGTTDITNNFEPNDATIADVDGDGQMEILVKQWSIPNNQTYTGTDYDRIEVFKLDGTLLWWIDCGPNLWDFQHNETNIAAYDWDMDGKAECIMRAADGTVVHAADGNTYTIGDPTKRYTRLNGTMTEAFVHEGGEYLLYLNGQTGVPYNIGPSGHPTYMEYPLKRLEDGETDLAKAWGDGYGHRSSKNFYGAPYLDGRHPSIFMARGIYTRHKMKAFDVDPSSHQLSLRWQWYNNTPGSPWYGQGYHNYAVADVDWDGRDEIVFGSMVIDDNGHGLSTTGLGHGDAEHVGDYNPYIHGEEIFACNEDAPANNYRDATTSKIYYREAGGSDDGRSMMGNFTNKYPGAIGASGHYDPISSVTNTYIDGYTTKPSLNFRIYWDGDLLDESLNGTGTRNSEFRIWNSDAGSSWNLTGSLTNNDTKATPCMQADIFGDWREEVIARTSDGNIRIYTTAIPTDYRIPTLLSDKQYRNAMVWQMNGYNQPPAVSYFLGELEGITVAPPAETNLGREEVANGGTISTSYNNRQVLMAETNDMTVNVAEGAAPEVFIDNAPTWVQGNDDNDNITTTTYTHTLTGGAFGGATRVVKQGDGVLTLPNVTETYSGNTDVWVGTLNFDGTMQNSPVWLNRLTTLNSHNGTFSKGITADYGATINVGGTSEKGTLTTTTLNLNFGSILGFKIYSDNSSDVLTAEKLVIEKKTWPNGNGPEFDAPRFKFTVDGGTPASGTYTIAKVSSIEGDISNVNIEGLTGQKAALSYENGEIKLTIGSVRGATNVEWTGATDGTWDIADTRNFRNGSDADIFVAGDNVTFNDNATTTNINIASPVMPASVVFDNNSKNYTLSGAAITGTSSITKNGDGALYINNVSDFTGSVTLNGGTTTVANLGQNSGVNNGAFGVYTNTVTLNGGTLSPSASLTTSHPIAVGNNGGTINVASGQTLTLDGSLTGGSGRTLTKDGSGTLALPASVSLGTLVVNGGTVQGTLNSSNVHAYPSTIILKGGALSDYNSMYPNSGTTHTANIQVPEEATATWYQDARANYNGSVSGAGTLNMVVRSIRCYHNGNFSNFTGTLNITGEKTTYDPILDFNSNINLSKANVRINVDGNNHGKNIQLGNLSGSATLSGDGTWIIGGRNENISFSGKFSGGKITKVGSGVWTMTTPANTSSVGGTVTVSGGTLKLNNTSSTTNFFGTNTVSVADTGRFEGRGHVYAINVQRGGTLAPGYATSENLVGTLNATNVYVRDGATAEFHVNSAKNNTSLTIGGVLELNGTVKVVLRSGLTPTAGSSYTVWTCTTLRGTPTLDLPDISSYVSDANPYGLKWNTDSLLATKGVISIVARTLDDVTAINAISGDKTVKAYVYTLSGQLLKNVECSKNNIVAILKQSGVKTGVYVVRFVDGVASETLKVIVK